MLSFRRTNSTSSISTPPGLVRLPTEDIEEGHNPSRGLEIPTIYPNPSYAESTDPSPRFFRRNFRRRNSLVTSRRYSDSDVATVEIICQSQAILDLWDVERKGYATIDQVTFEKVTTKFCEAVVRILGYGADGKITVEHIAECLTVLKSGALQAKVKLLVRFMDSDGSGDMSYDEIKEYLRVVDDKMMNRLGLSIQSHIQEDSSSGQTGKSVLSYRDILNLFQVSERGDEAISIFCEQILRILTSRVPSAPATASSAASEPLVHRNSISNMANEVGVSCVQTIYNTFGVLYCKLRDQLHRVTHVQTFKIALTFLQIFLWLYYFFHHKQKGYPLAFCFAKGFGLNLRILSLLIYFTMARTTMGHLYAVKVIRSFIPLGMNIEIHSFLGFSILMHAFGHTFGHIAYKEMYTEGFQTSFTQTSLLRTLDWEDKLKGDGKTGFILLAFLLIMGGTALFRAFSSIHYKWFYYCHFLYILYLPMIFLHVPQLWPYFLAITALIVLERTYDLYQNTLYATLYASRPCANGITFLSVPRYGMQTYPGSYYRIRVPAISPEWHPFSLAGSTSSHHLYFFIASVGDWTRALHSLVSDPHKREGTFIQVQGPFLAPASQALIRKPNAHVLCVASGIGITPFFSLMATKVTDEVNYENERIMYRTLFLETNDGGTKTQTNARSSLLEMIQTQYKTSDNNKESKDGGSNSNLLGSIISAVKKNTNTSLSDAITTASASNSTQLPQDEHIAPGSRSNSNSNMILANRKNSSRPGSNTNVLKTTESSPSKNKNATESALPTVDIGKLLGSSSENMEELIESAGGPVEKLLESGSPSLLFNLESTPELVPALPTVEEGKEPVREEKEVKKKQQSTEKLSKQETPEEEKAQSPDEGQSVLKVIWSIRELSELSFYVDYVHHIVKAQEQLMINEDVEEGSSSSHSQAEMKGEEDTATTNRNSQSSPKPSKKKRFRVVVEVEVFLTGLGSKSDPVYMLSQTLFLLSIAHTSNTYFKIHFGRPDLEKLVKEFQPEEVYYCGGNALKSKLSDVCHDAKIAFHPEDFDAGGGDVVRSVYAVGSTIQKTWYDFFPMCKPTLPTPSPPVSSSTASAKDNRANKNS